MSPSTDNQYSLSTAFALEQLEAHRERHAGAKRVPPLFLGINGVQGAGKTTLVSWLSYISRVFGDLGLRNIELRSDATRRGPGKVNVSSILIRVGYRCQEDAGETTPQFIRHSSFNRRLLLDTPRAGGISEAELRKPASTASRSTFDPRRCFGLVRAIEIAAGDAHQDPVL